MYKPLFNGIIKESNVQGLGVFATKDFDADDSRYCISNKISSHGTRTAFRAFYNHSDNPIVKMLQGLASFVNII